LQMILHPFSRDTSTRAAPELCTPPGPMPARYSGSPRSRRTRKERNCSDAKALVDRNIFLCLHSRSRRGSASRKAAAPSRGCRGPSRWGSIVWCSFNNSHIQDEAALTLFTISGFPHCNKLHPGLVPGEVSWLRRRKAKKDRSIAVDPSQSR
jgi:hypothetical protein